MPSPLVGLVLKRLAPPTRPSPPMNSLPPRLCLTACDGVVGIANGECGGVTGVGPAGLFGPAGLKEKSGNALTDFCLFPGVEPRLPAGYPWRDIGRVPGVEEVSEDGVSGACCGKVKSGFGMSSIGPAFEERRRW